MRFPIREVCLLLLQLTSCGPPNLAQQQQDVDNLPKAFSTLENLQVQAYRNQDWCKNIAYSYGKFSNTERSTCNLFQGKPKAFDQRAERNFKVVTEAISQTHVSLYWITNLKYSKQGKLKYAEFQLKNCSCYYIYSPNYQELPEDIPAERVHTAINPNWYFVRQDSL